VRSALVGREGELETLRAIVARAVDFSAPQLVTIVGNQGTGKSRLLAELAARLAPPVRVFQGRAESGGERNLILSSLLRNRFGILGPEVTPIARERFRAQVAAIMKSDQIGEVLYFLGGFLGMDWPASPFLQVLADNPKQKSDLARTVLRRFFEFDAEKSPLVLIFDDMQWADRDNLELVGELSTALAGSAVVVIVATRPEMLVSVSSWGRGAVDHERIDLRNLEADDAELMFRNLLARCERVPDRIAQDAVEMTGGNPQFIEQLVRLFIANGTVDTAAPVWRLDPALAAATELPISIEDAIEARVAALEADERELLERAAIFGNVFWVSAVVALTRLELPTEKLGPLDYQWGEGDMTRRRVSDLVASLAERDYLLVLEASDSTIPGDVEVMFKHNLERELISRSTSAEKQLRFSLAAAHWLEARMSLWSDEQLEFLAGLYERGGDRRSAVRCYLAGGDRARVRHAAEDACGLYERGLALQGNEDAPGRLEALCNLGDMLDQLGRVEHALGSFHQLLGLAWQYDNWGRAADAHGRLAAIARRQGKYELALRHLRVAHELFARLHDQLGVAAMLDERVHVHWLRGEHDAALALSLESLGLRRQLADRSALALALSNLGRLRQVRGDLSGAISDLREALALRRELGDRMGAMRTLCELGGALAAAGEQVAALERLVEALALARELGDRFALADVLCRCGELRTIAGDASQGLVEMRQGRQVAVSLGDETALVQCQLRLAEVTLRLGDGNAARLEAQELLEVGGRHGNPVVTGVGHRFLGQLEARDGRADAAEAQFRRSLDLLENSTGELELARTLETWAAWGESRGRESDARAMRDRASEIVARLRGPVVSR
jgi:tetratricopeptide (TPR) repeat protein